MVQGEKYANSSSSSSNYPSTYKSDESKRNGFMALQKQKQQQLDQRTTGSTGYGLGTKSTTNQTSTTNKNVWGPYFKNKEDFVNMHFS